MTQSNQYVDPYEAVLADLRAQREKIDQAIEMITSLRGIKSAVAMSAGTSMTAAVGAAVKEDAGSMFLGMSIPDAVLKLLTLRKRKMTNAEILAELKVGGLELTSQDPLNVIGSVLSRRFHSVGDIVRVDRGTWGLKAWYPGRNFKKAIAGPDKADDNVPANAIIEVLNAHEEGEGGTVFD